jgi:hypothetical protein
MRSVCALLLLLATMLCTQPADAQVSIGINAPGLSIGINLPVYPELVVMPGYPVYYAPNVAANYFFYDGLYWVFNVQDGQWYSSSWYNGPWVFVQPMYVPQPILVVPFGYYRLRPAYWGGWASDAPPRWGQHWGRDWESRRAGWDRWDRSRAYAAAPLPLYQREYTRDRYPAPSQQVTIHNDRYKYQAKDTKVQQQRNAIARQQSAGGTTATVKAERVDHPQGIEGKGPGPAPSAPPRAQRQETAQPERGRKPEAQRVESQPNAPRGQTPPEQAPNVERPPARPVVQQAPVQEHPGQGPNEHRGQSDRGPEGRPDEGQGQGRK